MEIIVVGIGRVGLVASYCLVEFATRETRELTQLYWGNLDNYLDKSKVSYMFNQPKLLVRFLIIRIARLFQILKVRLRH